MILRYRLEKFHQALIFQILWQTPTFTKTRDTSLSVPREERTRRFRYHHLNTPLIVASESCPEMSYDEIFLRGSESDDDFKLSFRMFSNNHDRDVYFKKVQQSLKSWAANWREWAPSSGVMEAEEQDLKRIPSGSRFFELHKG